MVEYEPRAVRRARAKSARPNGKGRKVEKAAIRVARHDADLLVQEALQSRGEVRARDRRNGAMPHAPRSAEAKAEERAERRAYRRKAAAT